MLQLKSNRKPYMGSLMALIDLTLSDIENKGQCHSGIEL